MDDVIGLRDPAEDLCRSLRKPFSPNSRKSSNCGTKAVAAAAAQEPRSTLSTDHARRPEDVPPRSGMMAGRTLTMECLCPSRGSTVGVSSFRSSCGAGENVQGFERKLYSNACTSPALSARLQRAHDKPGEIMVCCCPPSTASSGSERPILKSL